MVPKEDSPLMPHNLRSLIYKNLHFRKTRCRFYSLETPNNPDLDYGDGSGLNVHKLFLEMGSEDNCLHPDGLTR